jgi:hypothetical protein
VELALQMFSDDFNQRELTVKEAYTHAPPTPPHPALQEKISVEFLSREKSNTGADKAWPSYMNV